MPQDDQTPETDPEQAREDDEQKELLDDLDPEEAEAEDVTGGKRVSGRWDARY